MEKRSRHRIRDLVALTAIQGLSQNEIGCARISAMAMSKSAPFKGHSPISTPGLLDHDLETCGRKNTVNAQCLE
jgi:hypothetical protein